MKYILSLSLWYFIATKQINVRIEVVCVIVKVKVAV